ncbi:MAG TPA: hypothetical protein VKD72_25340 [Gemmataceae bacterium]|nr:hypothetical protein [Gemmataceae bacterium]
MRTRWLLVAALLGVSAASPARAGVYFPAEPTPWPLPTNPKHFQLLLGERQNVASLDPQVKKSPLRLRVEKMIKELEAKRQSGKLTVEESLNLSGCYLLQPRTEQQRSRLPDAVKVLEEAKRQEPNNFMIQANLAAAYQQMDNYDLAPRLQYSVVVPRKHKDFTPEQLRWYRRAEEYYRDLLNARAAEPPPRGGNVPLDGLFPRVKELAAPGRFQAGQIAPEIARELPPDALPLVQQLLLWMPNDSRLLWLYAELLNSRGDKDSMTIAEQILSQLVYTGFSSEVMKEHRTALREALVPEETPWSPDWRSVLVGLGTGVLVGVLLVLQFLQFRRWWSRPKPKPAALAASRDGNIGEDRPAVGRGTP